MVASITVRLPPVDRPAAFTSGPRPGTPSPGPTTYPRVTGSLDTAASLDRFRRLSARYIASPCRRARIHPKHHHGHLRASDSVRTGGACWPSGAGPGATMLADRADQPWSSSTKPLVTGAEEVGFEPAVLHPCAPRCWALAPCDLRFLPAGRDHSCPRTTSGSRCHTDPGRTTTPAAPRGKDTWTSAQPRTGLPQLSVAGIRSCGAARGRPWCAFWQI